MQGNDKKIYISKPNVNGVFSWHVHDGKAMATRSISQKYLERKSPPVGANLPENRGIVMQGNDNKLYISKPNVKGVFSWHVHDGKARTRRSSRSQTSQRKSQQANNTKKSQKQKSPLRARRSRAKRHMNRSQTDQKIGWVPLHNRVRRTHAHPSQPLFGGEDKHHYMFTDPAILGVTSTGDVDDVVAILYASLKLANNVTFVICDDDEACTRFKMFNTRLGNLLNRLFRCSFIKEDDIEKEALDDAVVHIYSQIKQTTAAYITESHFDKMFVQGNVKNAYNLLSEGGQIIFKFMQDQDESKVQAFSTNDTNFTIFNEKRVHKGLHPTMQLVYNDLFLFEVRKKIGLAAHIKGLVDRLYSDTSNEGQPGNGIKAFKQIIKGMDIKATDLPASLREALQASTQESTPSHNTMGNLVALVAILNMYCNYDALIRDGKLPHMGNLGEVIVRENVASDIRDLFETGNSTPLFDFAAMHWALSGKQSSKENLAGEVTRTIHAISDKLLDGGSGGGGGGGGGAHGDGGD